MNLIQPFVGLRVPMMVRSSVVLPTPFPPTNEVRRPSANFMLVPHKIGLHITEMNIVDF
jgi:hypothetical protein